MRKLRASFSTVFTLLLPLCARAADVESFVLAKGQQFRQTNAASPVQVSDRAPFRFFSSVTPADSNTVTGVSLHLPNSQVRMLTNFEGEYQLEQAFTNKSLLDGAFAAGKYTFTIQTVSDGTRTPLLSLPADAYPPTPHIANWLDAQEIDSAPADRLQVLERFVGRIDGVVFLSVREALPLPTRAVVTFEVAKPDIAEQRAGWVETLGPDGAQSAALLAGQFSFNLPGIKSLAQLARAESQRTERALEQVAWETCAGSARGRLGALAQALEPKVSWDDLVLPESETRLLRQIAVQVRHRAVVYSEWGFDRKMNRGFGISALFAGESGTGKTMAAEVIANELRLSLYRIDLSAVVNKYIGETEKNLRRLFDAAEGSGAILFFDEADALFGKRSEVKDSHDRYANIEINYLLQRIESYRGLAILATNQKNSLDTAFLRRLRFVVNFPFPDLAHRRLLWEKSFPRPDAAHGRPGVPVDDLDYERLARFNLSGGHIHNIALNAAFLAAEAGTPVTMPLVLEAARAEFLKLERPINSAEFHWPERNGARRVDQTLKVASVL